MSDWSIVNMEIQRSKIERTNYKSIFGQSLRDYVYSCYKKGMPSDWCYAEVCEKLISFGVTSKDVFRKAKIGVSSGYSEASMMGV